MFRQSELKTPNGGDASFRNGCDVNIGGKPSTALKAAGWILSIGTVIVAAITAGRPGFIYGAEKWPEELVRSWSTAVAIMSGLSALVPWQKSGRAFERAHETLRDAITLYDADPTYTVMHVIEAAREAVKELHLEDRTPLAAPRTQQKPSTQIVAGHVGDRSPDQGDRH